MHTFFGWWYFFAFRFFNRWCVFVLKNPFPGFAFFDRSSFDQTHDFCKFMYLWISVRCNTFFLSKFVLFKTVLRALCLFCWHSRFGGSSHWSNIIWSTGTFFNPTCTLKLKIVTNLSVTKVWIFQEVIPLRMNICDQFPISFIKIILSCHRNIGETITQW